jgi:hypothetical protein
MDSPVTKQNWEGFLFSLRKFDRTGFSRYFVLTTHGEQPYTLHCKGINCIEKFWDMQVSNVRHKHPHNRDG